MDSPDHILIVDDDAEIRASSASTCGKNGYQAGTVADASDVGCACARQGRSDCAGSDVAGEDGLTLCRKLRAESDTPVINAHCARRGNRPHRRPGNGRGRLLAKPFSPRELLRASRACWRTRACRELRADEARAIRFAGWRLTRWRGTWSRPRRGHSLSAAEYQLLRIFLSHPNHVLSATSSCCSPRHESDPLDRSIDIQVSRLRHRLGDAPTEPQIIKTVRGEGYVLACGQRWRNSAHSAAQSFGRLVLILLGGLIFAQLATPTSI